MYDEFSLTDGYKSIAEIIDSENPNDDPNKKKYLYLKKSNNEDHIKEVKITSENKKLAPLMVRQGDNQNTNRIYLAGSTLSGKSYLASKLAQDYNLIFPKNKVVFVTALDSDENINKKNIKNFIKLRIDESLLDDPIDLKELHDKLVIFDDFEAFNDKAVVKKLEHLRNDCLNAGRHHGIDVIVCRQSLLEASKTKSLLNNAFQVIGFPKSASRYQFGEYLKRYLHLDNEMIKKILSVPSRWCLVNCTSPLYVLHEYGAFIL